MFESTSEFINQISVLKDASPETKDLMVKLLVFEKQIEDRGESYAYKAQMNEIVDEFLEEHKK